MHGKVLKVESFLEKKQMLNEVKQETVVAGAKVTPAIGGATWYGFTLNEWVGLATLLYVVLQIGLLIPKYVKLFKDWLKK